MSSGPAPSRRLSVTTAALPGEPRRVFDRAAELGLGSVQLSAATPSMRPRELGPSARRDLVASLRRRELTVGGVDLWIPADHFSDAQHLDRAVGAMMETIDFAADLGRCPVSTSLPLDGDAVVDALIDHANHRGVPLVHHGHPLPDVSVLNEGLGFGLDPAAWLSHDADPIEACTSAGDHLASVRLVDLLHSGLRGPLGHGGDHRLDAALLAITLSALSYAGPLVIDARQWTDPWNGVMATIDVWSAAVPPRG